TQEVVYNLNEKGHDNGEDGEDKEREETADNELRSDGEVPGGSVGVDGATQACGSLPGADDTFDGACAVAEAGDGGHAPGAGAEGEPGQGSCSEPALAGVAGEETPYTLDYYSAGQTGKDAFEGAGSKENRDAFVKG